MLNNQSKNMTALYKDLKCDLHLKGKEGEKYVAMENFFLRMGLQIVSRRRLPSHDFCTGTPRVLLKSHGKYKVWKK